MKIAHIAIAAVMLTSFNTANAKQLDQDAVEALTPELEVLKINDEGTKESLKNGSFPMRALKRREMNCKQQNLDSPKTQSECEYAAKKIMEAAELK